MKKLGVLFTAITLLLLTACGTQGPVNVNATGEWAGTITDPDTSYSAPMTMTLDDTGGDLSGTAIVGGLVTADVSGVRDGRQATMTVSSELGTAPISLEGRFSSSSFTGEWRVPDGSTPAKVSLERR